MSIRPILFSGACLALVACIPSQQEAEDGGAGGGGGAVADGSLADAGGGGEGGEGGGVSCADCACPEIEIEAECTARGDCAARHDVFGEFADCVDAGEVMCRALSEAQCAERGDCEWRDGACAPPALSCADHAEMAGCVGASCYWWGDACHDDPEPRRCDQPDPASCEAAGCEWADDGCRVPLPACEDLQRPACEAREACRWRAERCEQDPAHMDCEEVDEMTCHLRADCGWTGEGCVALGNGPCAGLPEGMCVARPDCAPLYEEGYAGCDRVAVDCANVPADACERTPGCHVEVVPCCPPDTDCDCIDDRVCVPDGEPGCEALDIPACFQDPRCAIEEIEVCDDFGAGDAGAEAPPPDGDGAPDADFIAPPGGCRIEQVCATREVQGCDGLPPAQCAEQPECELVEPPCACDPMPCDCAPDEDCLCPEPEPCECELLCVDAEPPPGDCDGLAPIACGQQDGCAWVEVGGCACWVDENGEEFCDCDEVDGWCEPVDPVGCWDLDEAACVDDPDCAWVEGGGEPEPFPCDCAPDDPNCGCAGVPVPPPQGWCEEAFGDGGGGAEPGVPGEPEPDPEFFP